MITTAEIISLDGQPTIRVITETGHLIGYYETVEQLIAAMPGQGVDLADLVIEGEQP